MSSIFEIKKCKQSFTNYSIFKNSAEINIETAFFMSNFGPLCKLLGELYVKEVSSLFLHLESLIKDSFVKVYLLWYFSFSS
jgi:hypothetical protein